MTREFCNINDYYAALSGVKMDAYSNLLNVIIKYNAAQGGCGCNRQQRIDNANNEYNSLHARITPEEIEFLKTHFKVNTIVFKSGDSVIAQY
jgi:hypothetical protein